MLTGSFTRKREMDMQIPTIQISSQMGRIAIEQNDGTLEITQPNAEMHIKQPVADMSIRTTKGHLTIDQTQAWEETNLMSPIRFNKKHAQTGKQKAIEGIQRRAQQGAQLIDIHRNDNVMAQQAVQNGYRTYKTPSLTYIPSPLAVKTHYENGEVEMSIHAQKPIIDVQINKPIMYYRRGHVQILMDQHPNLTIHFA